MGNCGMVESTPQIVTVFRNRLRAGVEHAYGELAPHISELAQRMDGFVDAKTFVAADGERVTVVTFQDRETHNAWRDHPEHKLAQQRGISEFYETYSIQVGDVTYSHQFTTSESVS